MPFSSMFSCAAVYIEKKYSSFIKKIQEQSKYTSEVGLDLKSFKSTNFYFNN